MTAVTVRTEITLLPFLSFPFPFARLRFSSRYEIAKGRLNLIIVVAVIIKRFFDECPIALWLALIGAFD